MRIDIRKTLTIGSVALGILALPSFAMAAGGDDMRGGGRMGHMDHDGGMGRGGGRFGGERMGGERMGGERMGGRFDRDRGERGGFGRSAGRFGEDHGVRDFRERVRERHSGRQFGREDREREVREPRRERVHVARRFNEPRRFGYEGGVVRRAERGYEGGYRERRVGYGYPGRGYGLAFRHPVRFGFGYGRPRGRLVKVCTVRFLPFR